MDHHPQGLRRRRVPGRLDRPRGPGPEGRQGKGRRPRAGGQKFAARQGHGGHPTFNRLLSTASQGGTIRALEPARGLEVVDDRLPRRIPAELSPQPQRQVGQVAGGDDALAALEVRDRRPPRLDAVEEVAHVAAELVVLVPRIVTDRLGPERGGIERRPRRAGRPAVGLVDPRLPLHNYYTRRHPPIPPDDDADHQYRQFPRPRSAAA